MQRTAHGPRLQVGHAETPHPSTMPPGDAQRRGCPSFLASLPRLGLAPKPLVMGRDIQGSFGAARGCPQQHPKGGGVTCLPQPLGRCQPWPQLPAGWHGPRHGSWGGLPVRSAHSNRVWHAIF